MTPAGGQHPGLQQGVQKLPVQELIPEPAVEGFDVPVLPGAARLYEERPDPDPAKPCPHLVGGELSPVVRPDIFRHSPGKKQLVQSLQHVHGLKAPANVYGQAFPGIFIDDRQEPQRQPVAGAPMDEVVAPHVVGALGPQPHAGAVVQPEPPARPLPPGNLEPLLPPDALHPLVVDPPAFLFQKSGDPAVAVTPVVLGQADYVSPQPGLVVGLTGPVSLGRSRLPQHPAPPTFGNGQLGTCLGDRPAPFGRA